MIVALVIFAVLALAVVHSAQRTALDAQLAATAEAVRIIGDVRENELLVDAKDRGQFLTIVGARAQSAILASDGTILVSTDERTTRMLATHASDLASGTYADVKVGADTVRLYVTRITNAGKTIGETLAWRDLDVVDDLDRRVALAFAIAIPIIAGLAILAGTTIARRGLVPLDRIAILASEIEAHDLSRRLALPARPDELGRLAATFDRMLDRLQNAFDRERRFTNDASHELRAPLSVIRAEADLALRQERTPAEYRRALETIASESDALEALTRDLLAAARNGSDLEDVRERVDLGLVASAVAARMAVTRGARNVSVRETAADVALVDGNRTLIERALVGIVHNALKYSPQTGTIDIDVETTATHATISVGDDGPGFSESALQRGFDRFWRDDEARSSEGSGLGLSLAKTIVERYEGTIALANATPHGAIVRMSFPLAMRPL